MKILFTADIHIKLGQKNVPVEWAKNRYNLLIDSLNERQHDCNWFIIGGDIFDRVPTMEELEIYYKLITSIHKPCIIFPGNHESLKKDTTFFTHLKHVSHVLNPLVDIVDNYLTYSMPDDDLTPIFDIIPYNKLKDFEKNGNRLLTAPVLFTHVRGEIPPHVKPEVDLSIFDRWKTVIAGDLHSYENSQRNILYPGSPITTSFHRNRVDTGVILFDTNDHSHSWISLKLPQLLRLTVKAGEPTPATDYDHTIYEVEGDMSELSDLEDNDLIDKKLLKRESDVSLILDPSMSLSDELREYLLYILQLQEDKVENVLQVFNNNLEKI